jgi:hypothetical protein
MLNTLLTKLIEDLQAATRSTLAELTKLSSLNNLQYHNHNYLVPKTIGQTSNKAIQARKKSFTTKNCNNG